MGTHGHTPLKSKSQVASPWCKATGQRRAGVTRWPLPSWLPPKIPSPRQSIQNTDSPVPSIRPVQSVPTTTRAHVQAKMTVCSLYRHGGLFSPPSASPPAARSRTAKCAPQRLPVSSAAPHQSAEGVMWEVLHATSDHPSQVPASETLLPGTYTGIKDLAPYETGPARLPLFPARPRGKGVP